MKHKFEINLLVEVDESEDSIDFNYRSGIPDLESDVTDVLEGYFSSLGVLDSEVTLVKD